MKITHFTIVGLLFAILLVHMIKNNAFSKLWKAMAG